MLRSFLSSLFTGGRYLAYLEAENERLRKTNDELIDRILVVTTGLDRSGKPLYQPAPPLAESPVPTSAANAYTNLAAKEREILREMKAQFDGMIAEQARGFDASGSTPRPNGRIHDPRDPEIVQP